MPCCNESGTGRIAITQAEIDDGLAFQVEYSGGRTVTLKGPFTGKQYVFSGLQRIQAVDPRDAPGLLETRMFRLKGIKRGGD